MSESEFPIGSIWAPRHGKGSNRIVVEPRQVWSTSWLAEWLETAGPVVWYVVRPNGASDPVKLSSFRRWAGERIDKGDDS